MGARIDINSDMGESFGRYVLGNDAGVMPYVSSANIACGYHAGDPGVMRATVALAKAHGVGIGAHVSLPDPMGFGRRRMQIMPQELRDYVVYQYGALRAFADAAGVPVQHVKPHGALYVMCGENEAYARAVAEAILELDPELVLVLMDRPALDLARSMGVKVVHEGFVDLSYAPDGALILERAKQARNPATVSASAVRLAREQKVVAVDGTEIPVPARSVCVHGDASNAVEVARAVREALAAAEVEIVPLRQLVD